MPSESKPARDDAAQVTEDWHRRVAEDRLSRWRDKIPPALSGAGDLHPQVARWVGALVDGTAGNLVLAGPVATGKTWHAWHAVEAAYEAGWASNARVVTGYDWRQAVAPPADEATLGRLATAGCVVLDDLDAMRLGAWELEHLHGLVDRRWSARLPLVVTTNNPNLRDLLGERIASRIADRVTVVTLDGPDRRRSR